MMNTMKETPLSTASVKPKRNWTLIAIISVSILPIFAAYFMFFTGVGVPGETVNSGVLLPSPIKLDALIQNRDPAFVARTHKEKKWRLLLPITQECGKACVDNFYTTRQVHIRLSEKSQRVERVAVNIGGTVGLRIYDELHQTHPKLKLVNANLAEWQQWLNSSGMDLDADRRPFYLLVDQEGFVMMVYTTEQHGNQLLKDLKRALKYSIDYS